MADTISAMSKELGGAIFAKVKSVLKPIGQDFIKFVKTSPQYLLCSIVYCILASFLLNGLVNSIILAVLSYVISLFIVFTPLGEKVLRFFENVRKIETKQEKEYLLPLFQDVYIQAKKNNPELGYIELCVIDNMSVNACALGKRTIAVTKGAIETFSADELKATIAHEIAHILYGDTMARLYITVGNGLFTVVVLATKAILFIAEWIEMVANKSKSSFSFAWVIITLLKALFSLVLLVIQFLMKMVMAFGNRLSEFRADLYAYELGYGKKLVEAFYLMEKLQLGANSTVIQKMVANHPRISARIEQLENLLDEESAMQSAPLPLN